MAGKVIQIDRLAFGGEGVGRVEGKVVFVPRTAPGDRVRVRITSDQGRYERGEVMEVLEPSQDRIDPLCPVFSSCGGCHWQHLPYAKQLEWKEEILRETLKRVGGITEPLLLPIVPSPSPWHYRKRIRLQVDGEGAAGFFSDGTHRVVPFEECKIANPHLNEKLKEMRTRGTIPPNSFELSCNGSNQVDVLDIGAGGYEKGVFSQVNSAQNENLVKIVLDFAFGNAEPAFTQKRTVAELYAGSGNFTFPLAARAGRVIAVEVAPLAVRRGQEEAKSMGMRHVEWIEGTAEWGLKKIYRRRKALDVLVMDPPRKGASEVLDLVSLIRPRRIIYVSCDPAILARDLKIVLKRHFSLDKIQPVDMFPQTYHIESVALLSAIS